MSRSQKSLWSRETYIGLTYKGCARAHTPMKWVLCFLSTPTIFDVSGECTCTFVMPMVYEILVVDMVVCGMQV